MACAVREGMVGLVSGGGEIARGGRLGDGFRQMVL